MPHRTMPTPRTMPAGGGTAQIREPEPVRAPPPESRTSTGSPPAGDGTAASSAVGPAVLRTGPPVAAPPSPDRSATTLAGAAAYAVLLPAGLPAAERSAVAAFTRRISNRPR